MQESIRLRETGPAEASARFSGPPAAGPIFPLGTTLLRSGPWPGLNQHVREKRSTAGTGVAERPAGGQTASDSRTDRMAKSPRIPRGLRETPAGQRGFWPLPSKRPFKKPGASRRKAWELASPWLIFARRFREGDFRRGSPRSGPGGPCWERTPGRFLESGGLEMA